MASDTQKLSTGDEPPYFMLGELLKELRLQASLSQPDVATRMGVTQQTVSRWEAGMSRPRSNQVSSLAALFHFDTDDLLATAGYAKKTTVLTSAHPFPVDALSWDNFERFCTYLLELLYPGAKVHHAGTAGDVQDGLDIVVQLENGISMSFQCKRVKTFGPADVLDAVKKHTASATQKVLVLSRPATNKARRALDGYADWDIWDKEDISRKIRSLSTEEQIRMVDIFFRGQREALIGQSESGPWQKTNEFFAPLPTTRSPFHHTWQLVGHSSLISSLVQALDIEEPPLKLLIATGGGGKTRILKEVITEFENKHKGVVTVRFAAIHSEITLRGINDMGKRRKILIVDDAHERSDLEPLFCYAAVPENNTIILLATRPYGVQLLKGIASKYGLSESVDFSVPLFSVGEATSLSRQVLASYNGQTECAEAIARITYDCPLATVFASFVVAEEGTHPQLAFNHPQFRSTLLDRFQKIITGSIGTGSDTQLLENVMKVISLIQPFSPEDEAVFQLIESLEMIQPSESKRAVRILLDSGLLFKRSGKFRLSPDMLADFFLEKQCIADGGRSTGYAERAFDQCSTKYLKNLLVNLGKLDWRLSSQKGQAIQLLDGIWRKLTPTYENSDPHISAVTAVAYYQPERALAFAEELIRRRAFSFQLPELIRNTAYSYDYLKHACECLWAIGKEDTRELNQYPNHAIRILKKLCEYSPFQPLIFNAAVVDFAINLTHSPKSFEQKYVPFDILAGILETRIHRGVSTREGFILEQYDVPPDAVASLRLQVVDCVLNHLVGPNERTATLAARFIGDSLNYPVSRANDEAWSEHFEQILVKVETALSGVQLPPAVHIALENSVSWHRKYGTEKTSNIAKRISTRNSMDLDFRIFKALVQGWDLLDTDNSQNKQKEETALLISDLFKNSDSPERVCALLERQLSQVHSTNRGAQNAIVFTHMVIDHDPAIASVIGTIALENPNCELAKYVDIALGKLLREKHQAGLVLAENFLSSESPLLKKSIGLAYWRSRLTLSELEVSDLQLMKTILSSEDGDIASSAFTFLKVLTLHCKSSEEVRLFLDLARCVNLELHPSLAEGLFDFVVPDEISTRLEPNDVAYFLKVLLPLKNIDSYSIQRFLSLASLRSPLETARFLMQRIEFAMNTDDTAYSPYSKSAYERVQLRFKESAEFSFLVLTILEWLRSRDDIRFRRYGSELFDCMFSPIDETVLSHLSELLNNATQNDLVVLCLLICEFGREFILSETNFIENFLNKSEQFGPEVLDLNTKSLYYASMTGPKSGEFGKPFKEDLDTAQRTRTILDNLDRFAAAYKLYDLLAKYSASEIQRSSKEFEEADFDD